MIVLLDPLAGHAGQVEQFLNLIEGVLIDQRLMPCLENLLIRSSGLVDDPTGVVGVTQEAVEGRAFDLPNAVRMAAGRTTAQAEVVQLILQRGDGILPGRKQLEGGRQEGLPGGVEGHASNLAAIGQ
ncbi:MAG TPA: hypothetical protein VGH14_07555 [Solirubrobacterales bacterium]